MRQVLFWAIAPLTLIAALSATVLNSPSLQSRLNEVSSSISASLTQTKETPPESESEVALASRQPGGSGNLSSVEQGIIAETNRARRNPTAYAAWLQSMRKYYKGKELDLPGQIPIITQEGVTPVDEAVRALKAIEPMPPISMSRGMSLAARDHVKDQGPKGAIGHNSSDGSKPWDRVNRYGSWQTIVGENIMYGPAVPQQVVMQLIVDDGVADRGHRKNIFTPQYRIAGVACGPHKRYRTMCVIDYAGGYKDRVK